MPAGAPSKYKSEYCELAYHMLEDGKSFHVISAKIGIDTDTFLEWRKKYPELSVAIKKGMAASHAYWEEKGYGGMMGTIPGFNATVWIFNMKNRFGWRDRVEISEAEYDGVDFVDG